MTQTSARPILIIDGMNFFVRHFMANEEINNKGEPIGGVIGFLKGVNILLDKFAPQKIFVIWESGGPSPRRKRISSAYKANRSKLKEFTKYKAGTGNMKDVLRLDEETKVNQLLLLSKLLKTTPIHQIFVPETECDDIIAYLIRGKLVNNQNKKIIISSDKDFIQLLDDSTVEIYDPATKSLINEAKIIEKYSISARNFCLAKTLVGDESDNLEGVPGAGWITVAKRFPILSETNRDIMISDLLESSKLNLNNKKPIKLYKDVLNNEELIKTNWSLMYLNISTLSANQINKIDNIVDSHEYKMDKLSFIKILLEAGVATNLDIDNFCSELRNLLH